MACSRRDQLQRARDDVCVLRSQFLPKAPSLHRPLQALHHDHPDRSADLHFRAFRLLHTSAVRLDTLRHPSHEHHDAHLLVCKILFRYVQEEARLGANKVIQTFLQSYAKKKTFSVVKSRLHID